MKIRRIVSPMLLLAAACLVLVVIGMRAHTERFITPETGLGYMLGIIGASAMLVLLIYPARKRIRWLRFIGSVKHWFELHMALGLLGPLLVLFHSNFQLGATNSNVALVCMLVVSISGLFGRYFYSRIHMEFHGSKATLADLRADAARLQQVSTVIEFLPDLMQRIHAAEAGILKGVSGLPHLLRPPVVGLRAWLARRGLQGYIRLASRESALARGLPVEQLRREREAARNIADRRIDALRKVAEFEAYERLFSLWHLLHLPLFFMLVIAGVVHVISVHVY
jgi:hypothetical protein